MPWSAAPLRAYSGPARGTWSPARGQEALRSGVPVGADLSCPAGTTEPDADGNVAGAPFPVPEAWVKVRPKKQPSFDVPTLTHRRSTQLFRQSQAAYDKIIGTDDPDLSAFRDSGGKLLTWHGQAEQFIPAGGTVDCRKQVEQQMGGFRRVGGLHRLFRAPRHRPLRSRPGRRYDRRRRCADGPRRARHVPPDAARHADQRLRRGGLRRPLPAQERAPALHRTPGPDPSGRRHQPSPARWDGDRLRRGVAGVRSP
ncbi:tannase/feruloyl esterase family alpha/beta hydrolase [Streptomyces sp. NPDC008125]|uniref:tannase/feruloyl esterase family alpha/beta hydrolase n=1 Tax=Streptomyces sp. NPDC008125 TaxID=3364811 RepID=UPI0036EF3C81